MQGMRWVVKKGVRFLKGWEGEQVSGKKKKRREKTGNGDRTERKGGRDDRQEDISIKIM